MIKMDYRDLENGKYALTVKEGVIRDGTSGEIMFSQGKEYILIVKDGIYSIWDDCHEEEQISVNFSYLEWFDVRRV